MTGVQHVVLVRNHKHDAIVEVLGPFDSMDAAWDAVQRLDNGKFSAERKTLHPVLDAAYMDES